ncbi:MAG: hypothetical protein V1708_05820 [Candidatus Micrarchaeota archaeon]
MIGQDSLGTLIMAMVVVIIVLNMSVGIPIAALLWPFTGSIADKLVGVNLHGIDTLLILTGALLLLERAWSRFGVGILFVAFMAFMYLIM